MQTSIPESCNYCGCDHATCALCTPPTENDDAQAVVAPASSGSGVCTIDKSCNRSLLVYCAQYMDSQALLLRKFDGSKPGAYGDALWDGVCALRDRVEERVLTLKDSGCLLHVGCVK